jgi:1-acyl-sn-glycerol-3-phosphate acyltransferase
VLHTALRFSLQHVFRQRGFWIEGDPPMVEQPVIVACNHATARDALFLSVAIPVPTTIVEPALLPGRAALARRTCTLVQDDSHGGIRDFGATVLDARKVLVVFPENQLEPAGMGEFKMWTAQLSLTTGVPILPAVMDMSDGRCLRFGDELRPTGKADALTEQLHATMTALLG